MPDRIKQRPRMRISQKDESRIQETTWLFNNWRLEYTDKLNEGEYLKRFVFDGREQWTAQQRKDLEAKNKFHLSINTMLPIALNLKSHISFNRKEHRVLNEEGDNALADLQTKLLKYITENENDAQSLYEKVFMEGCIMPTGSWMRLRYGLKDNREQAILEYKNPLVMILDPQTRNYDLSDARGVFDSDFYNIGRIKEMFPAKARQIQKAHDAMHKGQSIFQVWTSGYADESSRDFFGLVEGIDYQNISQGQYRVITFNYVEHDNIKIATNRQTGEVHRLDDKQIEMIINAENAVMPNTWSISFQPVKTHKIRSVIPSLYMLLEDKKQEVQTGFFEYFRFAPYDLANRLIENVSVFTNLHDLQIEKNKLRSVALDQQSRLSTPKMMAKKGQLDNDNKERALSGDIEYVEFNPVGGDAPQWQFFQYNPIDRIQQEQIIDNDIEQVSQVTRASMGQSEREDNASLFAQKIEQASRGIAPLVKQLDITRENIARALLKFIKELYNVPRRINISDANNIQGEFLDVNIRHPLTGQIINDTSQGNFKVKLIDGAYNETVRARNARVAFALLNSGIPVELVPWDVLIEMLDIGEHTDNWAEHVRNVLQGQAESAEMAAQREDIMNQFMAQIEAQKVRQDGEQNDADRQLKTAELRLKAGEMEQKNKQQRSA